MSHFTLKERRARRRARSLVISKRRRDEHVARNHTDRSSGEVRVACVCELADWYFSKRPSFGCGCRKRRRGRPKVAAGMCDIGVRDRIFEWRHEARDLRVAVLVGRAAGVVEDEPAKHWPAGRGGGPKLYLVERRDLGRDGEPRGDWHEHRRYRTERDRDNAIRALRNNVQIYDIRNYRAGDEGVYRGPRKEFRAA